jgi:hypothetical protein
MENNLARMFHESPAATADMTVFRASSGVGPCGVLFKYASDPTPCGCTVAHPSPRSRDGNS